MGSSPFVPALTNPFAAPLVVAALGILLVAWSQSSAAGIAGTAVISLAGLVAAMLRRAGQQIDAILGEELTTPRTRRRRSRG
ncbi:hypothetical protein ACFVYA_33705 [Amycolatopsis sp. NPDC058278]|uniref:hypothetical protein n=1 Tax=Amycolatopsis sp. NPDC058278 TaxID=3346417 RepID=UPI0036DCA087